MKRILSFILCLVMIASLACPAYAEEPENETAGEIPAEEVILEEIPDVPEENEEPEQAEAPAEEEPKAEKTIENETFDADGSVVINATNFPDSVFRKYVSDNIDRDGSGSLSATELGSISSIDVDGLGISSLKGIKFFKNLSSIHCKDNNLSSLDVSNNTALTELWCSSNNLRSLDVSNNTALTNLNCRENALTSLDVSKNTALTKLDFCENELTEIDVSRNTALDYLHCAGNNIEHLELSRNTALYYLNCGRNELTGLDLSHNTALKYLFCYENDLTGLDLSHNNALLRLQCIGDNLSMLDISNIKVCTDSDLYGYFGQQQSGSVKVSMTEAQKACYDANFAQAYQNAGVVVKVAAAKPAITTQPANVSGAVGSSVKVSVKAEGEGLTYQWQYRTSSTGSWNSSTMTGAKTATMTIPVTAARNGYQYRCKVTNAAGTVYSNAATLTVF